MSDDTEPAPDLPMLRMRPEWGLIPALLGFLAGAAVAGDGFKIVLLPDTQNYSRSPVDIAQFQAQAQWIVDHWAVEEIVFVTHAGDVVEHGGEGVNQNQVEWDRAVAAMDIMDGALPYSVVPGNHDYDSVTSKASASRFLAHFGPPRYAARPWYGGSSPDQRNAYQTFEADGERFLHIGLEMLPPDSAIEWAQGVLAAHRDVPALITTHKHLGFGSPAPYHTEGATPNSTGDNDALNVHRKLVEPYPQVFLVLCGHDYIDGRRSSTTALGKTVHEVMFDYEEEPNGGNGWMQVMSFEPQHAEIEFSAMSPTYDPGTTVGENIGQRAASNYTLGFDLDGHRADLRATTTLHFRQGQDSGFGVYTGVRDTCIGDGAATRPDISYGGSNSVWVDGVVGHGQGLLGFDDIVGSEPGRIPAGATIDRAILTLTTEGQGASSASGARFHRLLVPWSESSTWNTLVDGIELGVESQALHDVDTAGRVASNDTNSFDVTDSVQAWVDGETNFGWVLAPNGNDLWQFRSSQWAGLVERPLLTVSFMTPCPEITSYCTAGVTTLGCQATLSATGTPSRSEASGFVLKATAVESRKKGMLFWGTEATSTPWGGGTSVLCVAAPRVRLGVQQSGGTPGTCEGVLEVDFNLWMTSNPDRAPAIGTTVYCQAWFRDPPSPASTNLSDALRFVICR